MVGIRTGSVPRGIDGPSLTAAAAGLMLLPSNASRLVRLHRLAALGMALNDTGAPPASPSAVRSILKREDIGDRRILMQEDPYPEVLVHSISFTGGPYLVSVGSGEHTVADLEDLVDAAFRERWMPDELRGPVHRLIQGLLTVSDIVLKRAGLTRGTPPGGSPRTPIDVPGAARLHALADAAFISNDELDDHGSWLRMVVDTFALDPGQLDNPCANVITDDRLYVTPFLRLGDGYLVALPLDLLISIRFHLLRFVHQAGQLEELGQRLRKAALRRFMRLLPSSSTPELLERSTAMSRYLLKIDSKRDLHLVVATDPLVDWELDVWGSYDTRTVLDNLAALVSPLTRCTYSSAEELLHLVLTDSPGRSAFWGVPNVEGADPMLIARSDDLEVIMHQEPDGLLGLLLFAEATENRPGRSVSTAVLDEFCSYVKNKKSFYLSDDAIPTLIVFQTGDGLYPRQQYIAETDRHGVVPPVPNPPIVQARRRYERDAPEIFLIEPSSSYVGYVVEMIDHTVFITVDIEGAEPVGVEPTLLECVAYWVRECAYRTGARPRAATTELTVRLIDPGSWRTVHDWSRADPAVRMTRVESGYTLAFTDTFVALLQEAANTAERELVTVLLTSLFGTASTDLGPRLDAVAPLGSKRMINALHQNHAPDMLAENLPRALKGHDQITAQVLDELGTWLRSPTGGGFQIGVLLGTERVRVLNAAVGHLFSRLEAEIASYDKHALLDFLVAQNEALLHDAKLNSITLKSRLACFGEQSQTVAELVDHRKTSATAQRANRFLIEYVAAQPPDGERVIEVLDYYRILSIAIELIQRAITSDFLHYKLADFDVSILGSGRLGVSREEPVTAAMDTYAANSGMRSVRGAVNDDARDGIDDFDVPDFIARSEPAMRAEFGFTLTELREVCEGLLDLATADQVTRIDRSRAISEVSTARSIAEEVVSAVVDGITLTERESFLGIGQDAWPWRFNRDASYVRRPLVLQGHELVFGFRSVYRLGPYWVDNLLSGRLQGRAKTAEMKRCISEARGKINNAFARSVAAKLEGLGMTTRLSVNKIGKHRITDPSGHDLGDIDVLATHPQTRTIIVVEAKDFEVARTPAEIIGELEKLFTGKRGKKPTIKLHSRRIDWLRQHLSEVTEFLGADGNGAPWHLAGAVVTSDPLITPLVNNSPFPVIPFDDFGLATLGLVPRGNGSSRSQRKRRRR